MKQFEKKTLNKNIPIPLYYQLKEILLEYIKNQHLDIEQPIPTEMEISKFFAVSRPTVRQAINELVTEGHLYRIKGKGTFVTKPKIDQHFLQVLDSFNNEMRQKGLVPSTEVLDAQLIKNPDERIRDSLQLGSNESVFLLRRIRSANSEPIIIVTTYIPSHLCPGLFQHDLESRSLYEVLEYEYQIIITRAVRSLESIAAGEYEAKQLNIRKGAPIQFFESVTYLEDGTAVEYSLAKYRGDRNKFTFELKRK